MGAADSVSSYGWARPERRLAELTGIPSSAQLGIVSAVFWIIGAVVSGIQGTFAEYLTYGFWWILLISLIMFEVAVEWGERLMEVGLVQLVSDPSVSIPGQGDVADVSGSDPEESLQALRSHLRPLLDDPRFLLLALAFMVFEVSFGRDSELWTTLTETPQIYYMLPLILLHNVIGARAVYVGGYTLNRVIRNLDQWLNIEFDALVRDPRNSLFGRFNNMIMLEFVAFVAIGAVMTPLLSDFYTFPFLGITLVLITAVPLIAVPHISFARLVNRIRYDGIAQLREQLAGVEPTDLSQFSKKMDIQLDLLRLELHPGTILTTSTILKLVAILLIELPVLNLAIGFV